MAEVYLGIGGNVGDPRENFSAAVREMRAFAEIQAASSLYRTEPVGFAEQEWFLNAVLKVRTALTPREFLEMLLAIEAKLGRVRAMRNGPRIVDLDILLWDDFVTDEPGLRIPHPRLHERLFVLAPLEEITPHLRHPQLGWTMAEMRARLTGTPAVEKLEAAPAEWTSNP